MRRLLPFVLLIPFVLLAQEKIILWYVTTADLEKTNTPVTGSGTKTVRLKNGWLCTASEASVANGRQTQCEKGETRIEFSVQCDTGRQQDHVQIRFRDPKGVLLDFVEVGCKVPRILR